MSASPNAAGIVIGVPRETTPGEARVALVPEVAAKFAKLGARVVLERGAGDAAKFPDAAYKDVEFVDSAAELYARADLLLKVQPLTPAEAGMLKSGAVHAGFMQAHNHLPAVQVLRDRQVTSFAMELVPRISRAQSMDALSSQAAISGYKAVLIGANTLDRFFPMLTTAAGTIRPATVLVIGVGVAGLQAIATAKRLGAIVEAYDVRSATRDQVKSLGAKFIETGVTAEGAGGYARELTAEEKATQQEVLDGRLVVADVVITTAGVPGRPAPRIVSKAVVERMKTGAVIVDILAENGGNCELTRAGETVQHGGVRIVGPVNLPAQLAYHASEMYARNLYNLLSPALKDGVLNFDWADEVFAGTVLTNAGQVKHEPTAKLLAAG
ncbi:MAG: NAD(P) transhydrogenase subunit alpha [Pseudomonadota bacterium]